jgi:hypothetical protein
MAKVLDYFEPWIARASTSWEWAFRFPPAVDDPEILSQWEGARERARRDAEWHVWGSGMCEPAPVVSLMGKAQVMDDRRILGGFRPYVTERENTPTHGQVAQRVAACVSACVGIVNPVDAIERARTLLWDMVNGKADASDPRVFACAARLMLPPPESQQPGCWEGE